MRSRKKTQKKHKVLEKIREKLQCFFLLLVLFSSIAILPSEDSYFFEHKNGITYLTHHQLKRYIILFFCKNSINRAHCCHNFYLKNCEKLIIQWERCHNNNDRPIAQFPFILCVSEKVNCIFYFHRS